MTPPAILPRSVHARRLRDFPDVLLTEERYGDNRGNWRDFFRQRIGPAYDGRIICEIGCSDAAFLAKIASKFPHTGFVGIDWKCKAICDAAKRVTDQQLPNIALLRARGQDIAHVFGPREVDEVYVFHPEPCERETEHETRLLSATFLVKVHEILRDGESLLAVKTDYPGIFQTLMSLYGGVINLFDTPFVSQDFWHDPAALAKTAPRSFANEKTLFEARFVRKNCPIYYLELRKRADVIV